MGEPKRLWVIEGAAEDGVFFRRKFPLSRYSEGQMANLLQMLSAKRELTYTEICEAAGRGRTALLDVHRSFSPVALVSGPSWTFTARVLLENDPQAMAPDVAC
jgi:hypothetical protein